jgi:hypothetical protein
MIDLADLWRGFPAVVIPPVVALYIVVLHAQTGDGDAK